MLLYCKRSADGVVIAVGVCPCVARSRGRPASYTAALDPARCVRHVSAYCDPFALKSLLGHTTLAMTNQYVAAE